MENDGVDATQPVNLPALQAKPKTAPKKGKRKSRDKTPVKANAKVQKQSSQVAVTSSPSEKKKPKDVSAAHPAMIGVDVHSMHPFHSELVDGLYKRPLVVSILIPKKRAKSFKYESSRKQMMVPSDLFSSGGEDTDDGSSKRLRSPDRPSSRQATAEGPKKRVLKIFIIKVYDLVESKEAVYPVVVRDFDKLLEEMIEEEKTLALWDYFKPQSLDWWAKSLRNILIVFDKPNSELSVVVDKKLIRRLVAENMKHHDWMDQTLSPEQLSIRNKMIIDKVRKKGSSSKKASRSSQDLSSSSELVPWNDYVASMGERNAGASFRGPNSAGSSSKANSSSVKPLPPVRSAKVPPPRVYVVGEWVHGNFKRAGQWFPGIIKKVHKDNEYYDIDYDDGRSEVHVEAKLVRPSAMEKIRDRSEMDALDLTSYRATDQEQDQNSAGALVESTTSCYEFANEEGGEFSASVVDGGSGEYGESFSESKYEEQPDLTCDVNDGPETAPTNDYHEDYANATRTTEEPIGYSENDVPSDPPIEELVSNEYYDSNQGLTEECYQHGDGTSADALASDYENQAYDYTNQVYISDEANKNLTTTDAPRSQETAEEVEDSAELIQAENSNIVRKVVTPYVDELISGVLSSKHPPPPEGHFPGEDTQDQMVSHHGDSGYELPVDSVNEQIDALLGNYEQQSTESLNETAPTNNQNNESAIEAGVRAASEAEADSIEDGEGVGEDVLAVFSDTAQSEELAGEGFLEESDYSEYETGGESPSGFRSSPSKIALASMMRTLSLEESSVESDVPSKSQKKSKKTKKVSKSRGSTSTKGLGQNSSSILLDSSMSEMSRTSSATKSKKIPRPKKGGDPGSIQVPEGLFKSPVRDRAKTAAAMQPPDVNKYVAEAASAVKTESRAATANGKKSRGSSSGGTSSKKKKKKSKTDSAVQQASGDHTAIAKEILKDVPLRDEDDQSIHSLRSLQSLHSNSSHHTVHFTVDAHGNFDHSHVPHYPLPHVSRVDATKAALEAIHKPHSNPHDRYTYLMMPAPVHMTHVEHHHYGYGPKHHHGHSTPHSEHSRSQDSAEHGHHHPGHHVELPGPHSVEYARALSPDSLREHNENHGHHHHHHGKPLHFPHHEHDFIVSTSLEEASHAAHHREPSIFSETVHSTVHGHHSPSQFSMSSSASGPLTLPNIHSTSSGSRPTSGHKHGHHTTDKASQNTKATSDHYNNNNNINSSAHDSNQNNQVASRVDSAGSDRPGSKSKRSSNPFAHKEKYKGPERRVIDIIEWARVSVGGSPKRQTRKISNVEKRLLKSPLALKLLVDAPINVDSLIEDLHHKKK